MLLLGGGVVGRLSRGLSKKKEETIYKARALRSRCALSRESGDLSRVGYESIEARCQAARTPQLLDEPMRALERKHLTATYNTLKHG